MKTIQKSLLLTAILAVFTLGIPACTSTQESDFALAMSNPQTTAAIANSTAAVLTIASIKDPSIAKYVPAIQAALPGALATAGSLSGAIAAATASANTTVGGNLTEDQQAVVAKAVTAAVTGNVSVAPAS
jgi:Zn-dependent protease